MPAGYSPRALADKLGIKPGSSLLLVKPPDGYATTLGALPPGVRLEARLRPGLDLVHVFVLRRAELLRGIAAWREAIFPAGTLWVSWPKRTSKVQSDVTEDVVRELALQSGLVDVKVCAVDRVWSGLKLVIPVKDRPAAPRRRKTPPIVRAGKARG
ncbi:MAG TPA: hypothetical protein VFV75_15590 [Candidatus Polarisedimenticolaceae bacterium]|nr:hypothetical protein [Candidatus Polarisedimenticolaceae bacterium]